MSPTPEEEHTSGGRSHERYFYHSFPRPKAGMDSIEKGKLILGSMLKHGLLLAPELVQWNDPSGTSPKHKTSAMQRRISFTELAPAEVAEHSTLFGPFAIEYEIDVLKGMGAIPTWYIPNSARRDSPEAAACSLLARLADAAGVVTDILGTLALTGPGMTISVRHHDGREMIGEFPEDARLAVNGYLTLLMGRSGVPPVEIRNALQAIGSLFYPTENLAYTAPLGYYRQREWRLIGGMFLGGEPIARPATEEQYELLLRIDRDFFSKTIEMADGLWPRGRKCHFAGHFDGKPALARARRVIAPTDALRHSEELVRQAGISCPVVATETLA